MIRFVIFTPIHFASSLAVYTCGSICALLGNGRSYISLKYQTKLGSLGPNFANISAPFLLHLLCHTNTTFQPEVLVTTANKVSNGMIHLYQ
jgi:hypothetical protein